MFPVGIITVNKVGKAPVLMKPIPKYREKKVRKANRYQSLPSHSRGEVTRKARITDRGQKTAD